VRVLHERHGHGGQGWLDKRIAGNSKAVPTDDDQAVPAGQERRDAFVTMCCGAPTASSAPSSGAAQRWRNEQHHDFRRGITGTGSVVVGFSLAATLAEVAHAAPKAGSTMQATWS
jgi:hypothetical protein